MSLRIGPLFLAVLNLLGLVNLVLHPGPYHEINLLVGGVTLGVLLRVAFDTKLDNL